MPYNFCNHDIFISLKIAMIFKVLLPHHVYAGCSSPAASIGNMQVKNVKLSRKVLYHFAIFTIVNEILIFENCRISAYPSCLPSKRCQIVERGTHLTQDLSLHVQMACACTLSTSQRFGPKRKRTRTCHLHM